MPPVGFEPTIPAGERPQTLDRNATGIGIVSVGRLKAQYRRHSRLVVVFII